MSDIQKSSQFEIQQQYISVERVLILLQDIKEERNISEKLERISLILQRNDINWDIHLFQKLMSTIEWVSKQFLSVDLKLTFESICKRINSDPRFSQFLKYRILEVLNHSQIRVREILAEPGTRIGARGFYGGRA